MNSNQTLYADIGNSTIDFLVTDFSSYSLTKVRTQDSEAILSFLKKQKGIIRAYVSSVNSSGLSLLYQAWNTFFATCPFLVIQEKQMQDYSKEHHLQVDNLDILGTDLFCDIIAVENKNGLIVIDLGTASKILYLDENSYFRGCQIFPGLASFPETLHAKTDLLKNEPILQNPPLVSLKTEECISSGVVNGVSALVAGMVQAIEKEYHNSGPTVILTGGNGLLIKDRLSYFRGGETTYDPYHVLKGLIRLSGQKVDFMKERGENDERKC